MAGTVIEELFPDGAGAVLAKDLGKHSIAEAAIPVLPDSRLASVLGRAAWNRVQHNFLEEHFAERFRLALAPIIVGYRLTDGAAPAKERSAHTKDRANDPADCSRSRS